MKVQLDHQEYLFEFDQRLGKRILGTTDDYQRVIKISQQVKHPQQHREILGHEICHVLLMQTGWEAFLTPEQLESACDVFGRKLALLIEDVLDKPEVWYKAMSHRDKP